MIKGLMITPPVIGRICIGHVVERNGKRLPEKDDFFTITTQVQSREGWMLHPLQTQLTEALKGKLRAIPVKLLFNSPDLNLRAQYSLFDRTTGRPVCTGDGQAAKRCTDAGMKELPCPSPELCEYGQSACKLFGRLNVQIEGQEDELGSFIFRTTGFNSVRTLAARLTYFNAISGGNAKHLPLMLRLRAKSTTLSHRSPVYYADLTLRDGANLANAVKQAREMAVSQAESGIDTLQFEDVARQGLGNGAFEESEEEAPAVAEEFFPVATTPNEVTPSSEKPRTTRIRPIALSDALHASVQG
jgi:hypothetical protein